MKDSLRKLNQARRNLRKFSTLSGTKQYTTFSITGEGIPETWCPEIRPKIKSEDLPDNFLFGKLVNGGSP